MPEPSTLLMFALAAVALIAVPGPNIIYITTRSLADGRRAGMVSVLGVESGTLIHVAAAAAGLSALLASSAVAFSIVRYAGAGYLIYLGLRTLLKHDDAQDGNDSPPPAALGHVYRQALLVQLLNPKVALFFLAFLPQFVDPDRAATSQVLVLGAIVAMLGVSIARSTRWQPERWVSGYDRTPRDSRAGDAT